MHESTRPRAVLRCDGSVDIGAGHLARCLTLADGLNKAGWSCVFLVNPGAQSVFPRLFQSQHDVRVLPDAELSSSEALASCPGDLLIVDHYQLGAAFEAACRDSFRLVMAIDDLANRPHRCDILLNQNDSFDGAAEDYEAVGRLLHGRQFAMLAPKFSALREEALRRRRNTISVDRLLICFGASDPRNFCGHAVAAVLQSRLNCHIDIAVSSASPNADLLRALPSREGIEIELHFDTQRMPELMARADLSVGAAGATTWERCCLGLPAIVYEVADNQAQISRALSQHGAAWVMGEVAGMDGSELTEAVEALSSDYDRRSRMVESASKMVDGEGVMRVVAEIEDLLTRQVGAAN